MRHSEDIKEFAAALAKAQSTMEQAAMDAENPGFKRDGKAMRYASLAAVLEAVRPPLSANGIAIVQSVRTGDKLVEVETLLLHTSGQYVGETLAIPVAQATAQAIGSAATYGKRYSLMAMAGIASADDDDDGNTAGHDITAVGNPQAYQPSAPPAPLDPSPSALEWAGNFRMLESVDAIVELKATPDFRAFWSRANGVDRAHVLSAVDELKANVEASS